MRSLHHRVRHHVARIHHKNKKFFINPFFWAIVILLGLFVFKSTYSSASADSSNPLRTASLSAIVQNIYGETIATEFPDGKSVIEVNINAFRQDGSPLINEPILIDKSSAIAYVGPSTTGDGQILLRFSSKKAVTSRIRVKLKNCATVKADFQIRFAQNNTIKNISDKDSFVFGVPLTLQMEMKPWMTDHAVSVKANYIYIRRFNSWGFWKHEKRVVSTDMKCNDGVCQATIDQTNTEQSHNQSGSFTYQFVLKDSNGKTITKSFKGKLRNP